MNWLADHLSSCELDEETESYALGRGAKMETIRETGLVTWDELSEDAPDRLFVDRYGKRGEKLGNALICPLRSPRGEIIGFEARSIHKKYISQFKLMPQAGWNPVWIGLHSEAMRKIWQGATIYIVEGQFDVYPLEWAYEGGVILGSLRAHLTRSHVEFLRRCALRGCAFRIVYDMDEAGRRGVEGWIDEESGKERWGAIKALKSVGIVCENVLYKGGDDPGEIWDRGGAEGIRKAFPKEEVWATSGRPGKTFTT